MIFMVVATLLGAASLQVAKSMLPFMIVLWLVAMNLFISPANSMIDSFAPAKKLPIVAGFLFLITELVYALEPAVEELVRFFGDTLTFIVGGVLISASGYIFHRVSSNEVIVRKKELVNQNHSPTTSKAYLAVIVIGLWLGFNKAVLFELFEDTIAMRFTEIDLMSRWITLSLLAGSAFFAFLVSFKLDHIEKSSALIWGIFCSGIGILLILLADNFILYISGGVLTALSFGWLNVLGLPYVFSIISVRHITYAVGIYIGASELLTGLFEFYLR